MKLDTWPTPSPPPGKLQASSALTGGWELKNSQEECHLPVQRC